MGSCVRRKSVYEKKSGVGGEGMGSCVRESVYGSCVRESVYEKKSGVGGEGEIGDVEIESTILRKSTCFPNIFNC